MREHCHKVIQYIIQHEPISRVILSCSANFLVRQHKAQMGQGVMKLGDSIHGESAVDVAICLF